MNVNGDRPSWMPDWQGECAAIVGSGPSVTKEQVALLKDRIHVIAINTSYELCPWADALYAADTKWWKLRNGAPDFKGLKITQCDHAAQIFKLNRVKIKESNNPNDPYCHDVLMDHWGEIGSGGNGGFQAMNILAQLGVKAMALLGFDFKDMDGKLHWHGRHPDSGGIPLNNPNVDAFRRWNERMNRAAPKFKQLGIDVVNCTQHSALECFPKMTVGQALERWRL